MDDLPKVGEKLVIVNEFGKKLLVAIHNIKNIYQTDGQRPNILNDANLQPVFKAVLKRFPDTGGLSQVQGANNFEASQKEILEKISEAYECLLGIVDFRDAALHVLGDCNRLVSLGTDMNPDVTNLFLKLLVCYVRVNLIASFFTDRKLVAAIYSRAYNLANGTSEPNYPRISKYLLDFESPIDKMHEDLFGLSARVGQVLGLMKANFDRSFPPTDSLFHDGPLNSLHNPSIIAKPSEEGRRLTDLAKPNEITEGILFGFLVCPSELSKQANFDIWKAALQRGFQYEIYRDELINFHQEFEQLLSSYKGNVKQAKSTFSEATSTMVSTCPIFHHERRTFLRLQLYQTYELLLDKPAVVVPKLSLLCSLLGMARDEVLWYFRHLDKPAPKNSKAKFRDEDNKDLLITEIIYLTQKIKGLILQQKAVIQQYYMSYLSGYYRTKLQQMVEQTSASQKFDEKTRNYFDALLASLDQLNSKPTNPDLEPFRLNFIRVQVFFTLPNSPVTSAASNLVSLLSEISGRTSYVDRLDEVLNANANFAVLYFEKAAFQNCFGISLKHVAQSQFAEAYFSMARGFLGNISPYFPKEASILGPRATQFLDQMYSDLAKRIAELIHEISLTTRDVSMKSVPEQTPNPFLKREAAKEGKSKKIPLGPSELDPNQPGTESQMRSNTEIKKMHARTQLVKHLTLALCQEDSVTFYDATFYPKQYLLEAISNRIRSFLLNVSRVEVLPTDPPGTPSIKRPSLALVEIESYLYAHLTIEAAANVGLTGLLRDILLDNVDLDSARKMTKSSQAEAAAAAAKKKRADTVPTGAGENPLLFAYGKWYIESFLAAVQGGGIVYSPFRKGFVSKSLNPIKIEKFANITEFYALAQIIGPNGLKYFEERLMRTISTTVGEIKEMLKVNEDSLAMVRENWQSEARCLDAQKRLKNIDGLYEKTSMLGTLLAFRSLMAEALSQVLNDKTYHLYNCIFNAHMQYPANTYGVAGYAAVDELANWAGIFQNVDVALRKNLAVHCQDPSYDRRIWDYLPYLYGITLSTLTNLDTSAYNTNVENSENNSICISVALNKLTVAIMSLVSSYEEANAVTNYQKTFLEVSSTCLLRLSKDKPKELDSVVLILSEFAEQSKFITADVLDEVLPYSYIKTAFSDTFKRRGKKKGKDDDLF